MEQLFHNMGVGSSIVNRSGSTAPVAAGAGGTQAVDRAAALLTLIVESDGPVTFTELAERTGLARSTTSRLLSALERTDLLARHDDGYAPGRLFAEHAARVGAADPHGDLLSAASPYLDELAAESRESAHLAVVRHGRLVHIANVETSHHLLGARDWDAVDVPDHCSALGKVLLAWDVLPLPSAPLATPTPHSLDAVALAEELRVVRRRGWAETHDELEVGLCGAAAPVRDARGHVVAALGVSGPTARIGNRADQLGRLIKNRAEALSLRLADTHAEEGVA
ncbi:IclR family transcriptional regulator [Nocardioides marmoribigeumensis]